MKHIILDTDMGPDCDDAAALALLHIFADQGRCRILGVAHCTSNPYGAGTIDAINRYYGRPEIAVSTYHGKGFLAEEHHMIYNRYITTHLPNRYRDTQPEEAVAMYRRILAEQEDKSVECVAIGPLNNLSALLNSRADEYSDLDGVTLVKQKVIRLTAMAGVYPTVTEMAELVRKDSGKPIAEIEEFNVACDVGAARNIAKNWPTPKIYLGGEAGLLVTGSTLSAFLPEDHPVRIAYQLYTNNKGRFSWDVFTVDFAVIPDNPRYRLSPAGTVRFDEKGRTIWTPDEDGTDHFVELAQPKEKIIGDIDRLLVTMPGKAERKQL